MKHSVQPAVIRCLMALGIALWSTGSGAQDNEGWREVETTDASALPEAIIALEREAEDAGRDETTDKLREQITRNARQWEQAQRERDRKLADVFDATEEYARQAARWHRHMQVLQLVGSSLSFISVIQEPLPVLTQPSETSGDNLGGEDIVLCEGTACVRISFSEVLNTLENAGSPIAGDIEALAALSALRGEFVSMGPVQCNVEGGECRAGEDLTREPAHIGAIVQLIQRIAPRVAPRAKSLGRVATRLIQRSGARSKQITKKWGDHAVEFQKDGLVKTRDGYARLAEYYMKRPHGTYRINHPDGRTLIFDPRTNVFTSFRGDRFITMFRPGENMKYWSRYVQNANIMGKLVTGKPMRTITWQTLPEQVRRQLGRLAR